MSVLGALTIAFSSILVKVADVSPSTAAIFRCVYAIPALLLLAWWESRGADAPVRGARERRLAWAAGVFFAADLLCWHHAIQDVGAGLATVLANLQVALVPLVAWAVLSEHPGRRVLAALPVVLGGVVLISGVLDQGAYGEHPARGAVFGVLTGLTYAGFLLLLRAATVDHTRPAGPLCDATISSALVAIAAGLVVGDADLLPSWPAHAWLLTLALTSQVLGWMLISRALPQLPAALTSVILTIQPMGSVLLGVVLLGESPTALQLVGVGAVLCGLVIVTAPSRHGPRAGADGEPARTGGPSAGAAAR
jgi:drug/metabolite transporter (DMT)-like permease